MKYKKISMKSAKKKIIDSKIHIKNYLPLIFFSRYISQRKRVSRHNILSFQTEKRTGNEEYSNGWMEIDAKSQSS